MTNLFKPRDNYSREKAIRIIRRLKPHESTQGFQSGVVDSLSGDEIFLFVTLAGTYPNTKHKNRLAYSSLFWVGQEKHGTDEKIINAKQEGKEIKLFCKARARAPFTYYGPINLIDHKRNTGKEPSYFYFRIEESGLEEKGLVSTAPDSDPLCTQRDSQGTVRVGQGRFRKRVLELWKGECSVTGLKNSDRLNLWASHIKPWRDCSNKERLDRYNGLLLAPNLERLFDSGLITFEEKGGKIIISRELKPRQQQLLGVRPNMKLRKVPIKACKYLEYHQHNLFENWKVTVLD